MRRNRLNLILLVAFHLAAFTQPLLVPSIHRYVHHHKIEKIPGNPSLENHEDICPISQFHFVHYIGTDNKQTHVALKGQPVVNALLPVSRFAEFIHLFFLRAPPMHSPQNCA
ncbi:hypothetical protein [Prolixibacter sp. SD074]|uniref:hypothetical protein n=1 Tax=Prolixibacter sp. SD074 TaxID=2652391 RepID=UPI00129908C6|nr:hypothetical protein [Prolixibacter sp. SD074]